MTRAVAFICGLKSEADIIAKALSAANAGAGARVFVSGANAQRAEELTRAAAAGGLKAILSVGVSGGLDPALRPGDLVIAETVRTASGEAFDCDPRLVAAMTAAVPEARRMAVFGADEIVASAAAKAALFASSRAGAVDMESHGAARAAKDAGVPFAAFRAVADPAARALPGAALDAVAPDGSTRVVATLLKCAKAPGDFPALLALGRDQSAALKALSGGLGRFLPGLLLGLDL